MHSILKRIGGSSGRKLTDFVGAGAGGEFVDHGHSRSTAGQCGGEVEGLVRHDLADNDALALEFGGEGIAYRAAGGQPDHVPAIEQRQRHRVVDARKTVLLEHAFLNSSMSSPVSSTRRFMRGCAGGS